MIGKIFKIILNTILGILIFIGVLVVFSFLKIPGNYKIYTVQSGSMEPAIHTGSLIFVKPLDGYKKGDIVTRTTKDGKATVTHRIIEEIEEKGEVYFKTKGDANDGEDSEKVFEKEIIGKSFLAVPLLGYPVSYAKTPAGLILIIIIPAVIIIYDEAQKIKKEILKKIDYRKRIKKREENNLVEEKNEETQEKI
jgi:signal peptidase I